MMSPLRYTLALAFAATLSLGSRAQAQAVPDPEPLPARPEAARAAAETAAAYHDDANTEAVLVDELSEAVARATVACATVKVSIDRLKRYQQVFQRMADLKDLPNNGFARLAIENSDALDAVTRAYRACWIDGRDPLAR